MDLQANYILSAAYAFGGAVGSTATGGGPLGARKSPFQWFTKSEWGPSLTDERNRVVVSGIFRLDRGIEASPIFQHGSVRPYNCLNSTDRTGSGGGDAGCVVNSSGTTLLRPPFRRRTQACVRGTRRWA